MLITTEPKSTLLFLKTPPDLQRPGTDWKSLITYSESYNYLKSGASIYGHDKASWSVWSDVPILVTH